MSTIPPEPPVPRIPPEPRDDSSHPPAPAPLPPTVPGTSTGRGTPTLAERAEAIGALLNPVDPRDPTWRWVIARSRDPRAPLLWLVGIGAVCALGVFLLGSRGDAIVFNPVLFMLRRLLVVGVGLVALALGAIGWLAYRLRAAAARRHTAANEFFMRAQDAPPEARADLLDRALAQWREALEVCPQNLGPAAWATTQLCLARAAAQRAQLGTPSAGGADDDPLLREAVTGYHVALRARAAQPNAPQGAARMWLATQRELATTLRLAAERAPNSERAERYVAATAPLRAILTAHVPEVTPRMWADTQIELAGTLATAARWAAPPEAYRLLSESAGAYHAASEVYLKYAGEREWAGLRRIYADTLRQAAGQATGAERARALDEALAAYAQALGVFTRWVSPGDWATLRLVSGQTWHERANLESYQPRHRELLQRAVAELDGALEVFTPGTQPEEWAASQQAQGEVVGDLALLAAEPERTQLLNEALAALEAAHAAFTHLGEAARAERARAAIQAIRSALAGARQSN